MEPPRSLFPDERQALILERLRTHGRVSAPALAQELMTSEHTIRRHLHDLAAAGHCKRVYGGALLTPPGPASASARQGQDAGRKARLGAAAATLVQAGMTVLIDAGSTNAAIAGALPERFGLTVISNAPAICARLGERPGFRIILIGGRFSADGGAAVGATALLQVQQIRADLCFLGACAFDPQGGATAYDSEEAELKRAMVKASGRLAIALTSEKLMATAPFFVAPAAAVDELVVEPDLPEAWRAGLRASCGTLLEARP